MNSMEVITMKNNNPPEISVTFVPWYELKQLITNCVYQFIHNMESYNSIRPYTEPACTKTQFYLTGIEPMKKPIVRGIIDDLRPLVSGYVIRITTRAEFDAMMTITITRKRIKTPKYFTISG